MDLESLRAEINQIDGEIALLFERRMQVVKQVAEFKKANKKRITNKAREEEVISRIRSLISDEKLKDYGEEIFRAIIELSKDYQSEIIDGEF